MSREKESRQSSNFNPRSREGSDESLIFPFQTVQWISIHAPARGATFDKRFCIIRVDISIHAPARGATEKGGIEIVKAYDFNPRSREGSDGLYISSPDVLFPISIHAPARGATVAGKLRAVLHQGFQSTLPRGERPLQCHQGDEWNGFQSTLPRGERRHHYI